MCVMFVADRTVMIWCTRDLQTKDRRSVRINVEFDSATHVCWSPDERAVLVHRRTDLCVEAYRLERRSGWLGSPQKAAKFPSVHEQDLVGMGIACNGRYIVTCSQGNDLVLWEPRGQQELARVDTYLMTTWRAGVSPCGKFVVASGKHAASMGQ